MEARTPRRGVARSETARQIAPPPDRAKRKDFKDAAMDVIVDVKRHSYDQLLVLEDIKMHVREGEIVAVIGPSGCGKSTLLGIVGGILKASDGGVFLEGQPPRDCLNPLTFIFQDFALLPWRSVAKNVALPLGAPQARRRKPCRRA